jgi:hypothetical protein
MPRLRLKTPQLATAGPHGQLPSELLGSDHPLTRAYESLEAVRRQLLVVAALLAGSMVDALEGVAWARSAAIAGAIVLAGVAAAALLLVGIRRERAVELIAQGRENLPVTLVQRQCIRLASPRTRRSLARTLESMIEETLHPRRVSIPSARLSLNRRLIASLQDELRRVARLLRDDRVTTRGVAFSERLLTRGESPLYGRDIVALRAELRRARALLAGG